MILTGTGDAKMAGPVGRQLFGSEDLVLPQAQSAG